MEEEFAFDDLCCCEVVIMHLCVFGLVPMWSYY